MAEYNITYEEIQEFVDVCIGKSPDSEKMEMHRSEILAAIAARDENVEENDVSIRESIELWENQTKAPSKLLLGTHYIVIKDSVIALIEAAFTSGLIDVVIANPQKPMTGITIGAASSVVCSLIRFFKSISKLDDFDFCVYMQAVAHFRKHQGFTVRELEQWLPHGTNGICNMHNQKWDCEHHQLSDDTCKMLQGDKLKEALDSLCNKNVLISEGKDAKVVYKFKT